MLGADSSKDNRPVVQRALPFGVIDCECAIGWRPLGLTDPADAVDALPDSRKML